MRKRYAGAAVALAAVAALGGAAAANAALSAGTGVLVCFPSGTGPIIKPSSGATCPGGYYRVWASNQSTASQLVSRVNSLTTFLIGNLPPSAAANIIASKSVSHTMDIGFAATNLAPYTTVTAVVRDAISSSTLATFTLATSAGGDGSTAQTAPKHVACTQGHSITVTVSGLDLAGTKRTATASAQCA